jgi:hypothetical protein
MAWKFRIFLGGWSHLIHPRHKGVGVWEDSRRHKGVGVWEDSGRHEAVGGWEGSRRHEGVGVWGDGRMRITASRALGACLRG